MDKSETLDQALADADSKRARGFGAVNVLDSARYSQASLSCCYWIEHLGPFNTRDEADAACTDLKARGLAPDGNGDCYSKSNPLALR